LQYVLSLQHVQSAIAVCEQLLGVKFLEEEVYPRTDGGKGPMAVRVSCMGVGHHASVDPVPGPAQDQAMPAQDQAMNTIAKFA
jgi:hypothetical protein